MIEVLSPRDPFTRVTEKCRRYAAWGVADILVFDPAGRQAWRWDAMSNNLVQFYDSYAFQSKTGAELILGDVFRRMDQEL